jgi:hypothetical protein
LAAVPSGRLPSEVVTNAGWKHGTVPPDKAASHGALRAKLDHLVNPLPQFHRYVTLDHVFTPPNLPGERFLVFYDLSAGDAALAYRCTADGRLIVKGPLHVSP